MTLRVGQVFKGTVPLRSGDRSLLFRILEIQPHFISIQLTPLPGDEPLRTTTLHVDRLDLELMIKSDLAEVVTHWPCPSCQKRMILYDGFKGRRKGTFFACTHCEECFEV